MQKPANGCFRSQDCRSRAGCRTSALQPFSGTPDPLGALGGPWVVLGGLQTPKKILSFWDQFWPWNALFWVITTCYTMILVFWVKMGPSGPKKGPFGAKIGFAEKRIFLKNIGSNFDENARKVLFWVNNELRKRWASSFIENFSVRQNWHFWSRAPFGPFLSPGDSPDGPKLFYTVYLGGTHPYHILGPLNRPLRHSGGMNILTYFFTRNVPFDLLIKDL